MMAALLRLLFATVVVVSGLACAFLGGFIAGRAQEVAHVHVLLEQPDRCWETRLPDPEPLTLVPVVWCAMLEDAPRPDP